MKSKFANGGFWLAPTIISNEPFRYLLLFACLLASPAARAQTFLTGTEGFESGFDGWTTDNSAVWRVGKPTAGPRAAYAGTNCAGTGLSGNAPAWQSTRLMSPVFVVPAASQNPRLRWWQWFSFGWSQDTGGDGGDLQVSTNTGASWQTLASYGGSSGVWSEPLVDLSAYAGLSVQIAFHFHSQADGNDNADGGGGPGWFVDNVTLVTGPITTITTNAPVGFESGLGDWSVNNGVWAVGKPTAGPGTAYAGTNCAGTGLSGDAPAYQSSQLISPMFIVPAASQNPRLRWWQWFSFGWSQDTGNDGGDLQVSTNTGASWQTLASYGGSSGVWSEPLVDLSAYAGLSVQIAFHFHSQADGNDNADGGGGPGWFVDNVTLVTGPITTITTNAPVGFESGLGDWWVNNGVWAVGKPTTGPGTAYAGTNCAGTGLAGDAPAWQSSLLISPMFMVPAASQNPRLRWWQWFSFGWSQDTGGDGGDLQVSTNTGASWQTLASYGGSSGVWSEPLVDLSAYAGLSVQIAFHFHSQADGNDNADGGGGLGWFVDNVTMVTGPITTITTNAPV
jgi:hypothetical protein